MFRLEKSTFEQNNSPVDWKWTQEKRCPCTPAFRAPASSQLRFDRFKLHKITGASIVLTAGAWLRPEIIQLASGKQQQTSIVSAFTIRCPRTCGFTPSSFFLNRPCSNMYQLGEWPRSSEYGVLEASGQISQYMKTVWMPWSINFHTEDVQHWRPWRLPKLLVMQEINSNLPHLFAPYETYVSRCFIT